ncbi:MAG TPA: farnesyl diphosphate synthase [Gemmatimonadaceae bacterium]|nr:farnesyl diphosphate synthase [Gemmatimonadaceae bacterium]
MSDVDDALQRWRASIDAELAGVAERAGALPSRLRDAVHYGLTGEGKRLRGLLLFSAYHAMNGDGDAAALAAAVEVVHAYSLVHDDLPCMDNDSMRRGRPTTHRAFDVATATVAGVAMVPLAVSQVIRGARRMRLDEEPTRRLVRTLMRASGAEGMVGGQLKDLDGEGRNLGITDLEGVHAAKTGALIAAALTMGGIAARGGADQIDALDQAGHALGLAFQIADDVLDATASSEALGKTAGHDAAMAKSTYASVLGVAPARARRDELVARAQAILDRAGLASEPLGQLAHFVAARRS